MRNFNMEEVDPDDLHKIFEDPEDPKHLETIYVTTFRQQHMVERTDDPDSEFDKMHYYKNPHLYQSKFENTYL